MSITKIALRFAAPLPDIESFERILFIGPHPDDIEIGAGATAAKLAAMGKEICFLICTDGRYGSSNLKEPMTPEELTELRRKEAIASAELLGVKEVRFLPLSDGGFYSMERLIAEMAKAVGDFAPQLIFAPDPTLHSECHIDHLNVGEAARRVACAAPNKGIMAAFGTKCAPVKAIAFYMTAKPNSYVKTSGYQKHQADSIFGCHRSQYPMGCEAQKSLALYLKLRAADMGLRCFCKSAEGFRLLDTTHMHCLPEADG